ncbi:S-adenosyl-methyltransferase MraW [Clostridiales bacterium KA00134]|nr:S-adenosyl-methyltransferase MraW [Clostridiales bacterium KA00134]
MEFRWIMDFVHKPVLFDEVIENLNIRPSKIYLDGTLGGAGHSSEILRRLCGDGLLIGLDQDEKAIEVSRERLEKIGSNFKLFNTNYENFEAVLDGLGIDKLDGILLDLGVSSYQFDMKERGFSYRLDSRLDMRMDRKQEFSAWDIVNKYSEGEIARILLVYGEERWARRIANFIVKKREEKPIDTTFELVEIIKAAIPKKVRREGSHPAKKTFQALRIETNHELDVLKKSLGKMIDRLNPGGRICVISFHSLEDHLVKDIFKYYYLDCVCPPEIPVCICDKKREIEIISKNPILPSDEEILYNNRSRSAKLRVAEKL